MTMELYSSWRREKRKGGDGLSKQAHNKKKDARYWKNNNLIDPLLTTSI